MQSSSAIAYSAYSSEPLVNAGPQALRLFRAWVLFAATLVGLAALFVVPAALGSAAGTEVLGSVTIVRFLVGHIFFSLVLASTAFVVVLWMQTIFSLEGSRLPLRAARIGFWLSVAGSMLAVIGTLGAWGEPILTEFVPVVAEPAFLSGLGLFLAGVGLSTGCFIYAVIDAQVERMPLVPYGLLCTAAMMVATGLAGIASITRLFGDWFAFELAWRTPYILLQAIFWGPAHLIQFAVVGAMVAAWIWLLPGPGLEGWRERLGRIGFVLQVVCAAITLVILYAQNPLALPKNTTLNIAVSVAQTAPVVPLALLILQAWFRQGRSGSTLISSLFLFALGIVIAVAGIRQPSPAWVPSHYYALIPGAVLIAFMGATTELLPQLSRRLPSGPLAAIQLHLYSGGILTLAVGMLWAALAGGERRAYFVTVPATGPAALMWIGGTGAGLGAIAFVGNTLRALWSATDLPAVAEAPESS